MRSFILIGLFMQVLLLNQAYAEQKSNNDNLRIIALAPHAVEMLYALGAGKNIVGTVEYADYPEAAKTIRRIGNYAGIQIEQLVALKPDLIVAWKSGNRAEDLAKIESLGFPIYYTSPQTINEVFTDLANLGEKTGQINEAKEIVAELKTEYSKIKQRYNNKRKVKVFYQLWHDPTRTIGKDSWINSMIEDCNGINIFSDTDAGYPLVAFETVVVKNPEVIIIPHHSGEQGAKVDIWKKWQEVDAVKNDRLSVLNGDLLHRFSPRAIEGLSKLCGAIDTAR
ncbi:MAG: cobalamin-binding protein [Gammaproteobacteria bacterium]|nr:cobalamin-binding protein [Gammaproteobacteria bacterium]